MAAVGNCIGAPPGEDTLLSTHAQWLREPGPAVNLSAWIPYQGLHRQHGYTGGYDTVKRFVAPLREPADAGQLTWTGFEIEPGRQSRMDWGEVPVGPHAQRSTAPERLRVDAGGSRQHLYHRPRTVCRAYRAQTKGKVTSGVKHVSRNFMAGRRFVDAIDVPEQQFKREVTQLLPVHRHPSLLAEARVSRGRVGRRPCQPLRGVVLPGRRHALFAGGHHLTIHPAHGPGMEALLA